MYSTFYIPHHATHAPGFHLARTAAGAIGLACVILLGYLSIDVFKDIRLVSQAFPALPSDFGMDMDVSIFFSPIMLRLDVLGNGFLKWIKYPPGTLPNAPLPTGNPIEDQILKARKRQGLLRPGGSAPLDQLMLLNQESLEGNGLTLTRFGPLRLRDNRQWVLFQFLARQVDPSCLPSPRNRPDRFRR